ncbi:MAG: hypothetical protein JKY84_08380 [Emcibacteraceae bacterium]|nr:hypothetical protein [Emcibacteraceae bacterium]
MNKDHTARKPLRQRVADRKRGIKEVIPMSERKKKILKITRIILLASTYLGLLMLLLSLGGIVTDDYEIKNVGLIELYCAMFLVGRFGLMILKSLTMLK